MENEKYYIAVNAQPLMQATDIRFVCPPSRAMLTVTDRFALDVIEFVDMSNQRYRTEDGKHNCGNGD